MTLWFCYACTSAVSHVTLGDALFLSPATAAFLISSHQWGCIKGPSFSPNQRSLFPVKLPPILAPVNFYMKEPEWIESAAQFVSRSWLVAKTGRFPNSGAEKSLLLVQRRVFEIPRVSDTASTLYRGVEAIHLSRLTTSLLNRYWFLLFRTQMVSFNLSYMN